MASTNQESKLNELIEKFGGWAAIALVTVICFMYQNDKADLQENMNSLERSISSNSRAISRLQEGKVSREEFKTVQEQWIRETQGLRQDVRDLTNALRIDLRSSDKPK